MKKAVIALCVLFAATTLAVRAAVIKVGGIETPSPTFVPDSVQISAGDTLQWYQINGDHTATSGTGSGDPDAGNDYNGAFGTGQPIFQHQFNAPGTYQNFCIPHELFGMTGKVVVTPTVAAHVRATDILAFDPDSVPVLTGQTVEFYWSGNDAHTLTSGTGSGDPNAGNLINSPLDASVPAIQLTFNSPGVYPFFCTPHEFANMRTTVYVSTPCNCPCKFDPQCDGIISNVQDVVITVNVAFRGAAPTVDAGCPNERTDVDANGVTSVTDVVKVVNVAFRGQTAAANYVDPCL
ncbi:MAG TPA: plastocyanin/azurin family copper-binding protein [bacterium]|nr:plastocyanin/azurin family copper-binding protein [bacterium]